ncbi:MULTISPECIES: ABC transporter substrate-binding protein [Mesotoga]|uniref:ABC-type branched-chain amino acid transport system, periplasmic component n=1 Tax=Mesotoga prima MesG1.Ag.4.2 TaxID=660470 RepID=I2F3V7_9BACT|nr:MULTISPECIES: ABC transporter substrate-binding protein [Mesotoga]MCP5456765.1 ABC transporter substrate-binding protein [Thermotogota bacterium]CCU86142.1 Extracellular ligand-binding receptor [Mesotoga infera]AFK06610.1 ABC-type branched-chain amino acid transport system, periplasmic component [Mesotoga prima MesG1.Ag.4.2]RLL86787.1 branched-chain amino acid ABC transporter substrate-binding protein [Mesotoga sp. H07pep.5.4]RLL92547.1 branched-chain amino acid ABC transporter substrate-bi
MKRILVLASVLLMGFILFAVEPIVIGVFEPMTGPYAAGGQLTMEGINLAAEQVTEVLGRPIELVLVDNKSEKVEASNAVSRLIQFNKASVIIGSYGSAVAIPGSEVANAAGVPMIGCSPTNPLVTLGKPYAFRVCFIDPFQGSVMAKFAVNELGAKTAVIIQDIASDYSVGLSHYFQNSFKALTGDNKSISGVISYQTGDQDFTAQLAYAQGKNPDVIFIPAASYGEAALIIKQARELGIESQFLGGDTWEVPEFLQVGGAAVEGSYFSTHFDVSVAPTPKAAEFIEAFKAKYGVEPSAFSALGYDAFMLAVDAIKRAGSAVPEDIKNALSETVAFEGVTGYITIDENGDAIKDAIVRKVENGVFKFVSVVKPAE